MLKPRKRTLTVFRCRWFPLGLIVLLAGIGQVNAKDAIPEIVVTGLSNPSGVAIQPNTGHVFVADSGAGRIVRVVDGTVEAVITDFPADRYGANPAYKIGPLGLLFLDEKTLVVGGGGLPDGKDLLRVFKVPSVGEKAIKASEVFSKALLAGHDKGKQPGEGNFYGLAQCNAGIFVTCNSGDNTKGWVSLATLGSDNRIKKFSRSIATKVTTTDDAPVAITTSPEQYLAVGQMGSVADEQDSLLAFYSQAGTKLSVFETGLNDITGLDYGPRYGRLFAVDFNWANPQQGGLYKLVKMKSETACESVLISRLERPTALVFTDSGDCYITLAGSTKPADGKPDGKLVIIRQLDIDPNQ